MKLNGLNFADVAEIQEAVTDELKKVQIQKFSAAFQKTYDREKAYVCVCVYIYIYIYIYIYMHVRKTHF